MFIKLFRCAFGSFLDLGDDCFSLCFKGIHVLSCGCVELGGNVFGDTSTDSVRLDLLKNSTLLILKYLLQDVTQVEDGLIGELKGVRFEFFVFGNEFLAIIFLKIASICSECSCLF